MGSVISLQCSRTVVLERTRLWAQVWVACGVLVGLLALGGCSRAEEALEQHQSSLAAGDLNRAEEVLAAGLEAHSDHVPLLCAAASFYLQEEPRGVYKPRLALHYAMRADMSARGLDTEAARLLGMAHRAAGGPTALPEGEELLRAGLEQINHPDARNPRQLRPFDPDLLELSLENVLEQKARWERGRVQPTCPEDQLLVSAGRYPVESTGNLPQEPSKEVEVPAFCVLRMPSLDSSCGGSNERPCSAAETAVVRGPIAAALWGNPRAVRCCYEPTFARVKPGSN